MNVIVSNKYQNMLATLDIDIIKSINGEFEVEELVSLFTNFYFNRMIIDITAIKGYQNIKTIQQLSVNFDPNKIILSGFSAIKSSSNFLVYFSEPWISLAIISFILFLLSYINQYD